MSSTASFTSSSAFSSPTAPPSSSDGGNRGANYFFGFLITFIALLLLFIGCGIGTRRRLQRRGALLDFGAWGDSSSYIASQEEPKLLEPLFVSSEKDSAGVRWSSLQPLSTSLIPPSLSSGTPIKKKRPSVPIRMPSSNPTAYHGLSLPIWRRRSSNSLQRASNNPNAEEAMELTPSGPSTMQVGIMILMPLQEKPAPHDPDDIRVPEYQLGVAHIPWDKGRP